VIAQVRSLFRHRLLVQSLVGRELKARYRGSVLGFFWSFINPLLQLLTYGLVFSVILPVGRSPAMDPYLLFFFCGILPWSFFQSSIVESSGVLIAGGNLIKKVLFPAEVLPMVAILANLAHFLLGLPVLLAFVLYARRMTWTALLLPLPLLVQLVLTLGLGLIVSALTVHFRDLQNILGHLLHLWFFSSPILYHYREQVSDRVRALLRFNPMYHLVVSYQQMLFEGRFDHWRGLLLTGLASLVVLALGLLFFERLRDTLPEEV
jgi:homopolymeric O-antigen transport system permease protein